MVSVVVFFRLVLLRMRISAAPSQVQGKSFKKTRFIPPGRSNADVSKEITKMSPDPKLFQVNQRRGSG